MKTSINILSTFVLGLIFAQAQVAIGEGDITPHEKSILTIINPGNSATTSKGLILPAVEKYEDLPLYNPSQLDFFDDDPQMEGLILYVKEQNEDRAFYYNGKTWVDAFSQKTRIKTRVSLNPETPNENLPKTTCVLVACEKVDIPFFKFSEEDVDELRILDHATQKIRIRNSGLYRIQVSIAFRSSGVHVTPPQISIQALKNEEIVGQAIANMNTLLISGNAPMTASATFNIWAEPNDILSFTAGGAIPILTIADTYTAQPNPATFVIIERIL